MAPAKVLVIAAAWSAPHAAVVAAGMGRTTVVDPHLVTGP